MYLSSDGSLYFVKVPKLMNSSFRGDFSLINSTSVDFS